MTALALHTSVLDALCHMCWAWGMVTPETIANCFKNTGFYKEDATASVLAPDCDVVTEELSALFSCIENVDAGFQGVCQHQQRLGGEQ